MNLPSSRPAQVVAAWTVSGRDVPAGYGLRVRGRSRSGTFTALIVLDAGFLIRDVDVERYRGVRGSEIRRRSFQNQFRGKTPNADLRIGKGVDAVTGATISSKAFTDAVRSGARWLKMFCNRS